MIKLSGLKIVSENADEIIAFCPFHDDKKRPNLLVSKTGKFAGWYKCWACGAFGQMEGDFKAGKLKCRPNSTNWQALNDMYRQQISVQQQWKLKQKWGVRWKVLEKMEVGYDGSAWTFPVRDSGLNIVGLQRIFPNGDKRMVNGSKIGIFVTFDTSWNDVIYITEGISDLSVALDMGLNAIGRLSCSCGNKILKNLLTKRSKYGIIGDRDDAGIQGAKKLKKDLDEVGKAIIIVPEVGNDLREWRDKWGSKNTKSYLMNILTKC